MKAWLRRVFVGEVYPAPPADAIVADAAERAKEGDGEAIVSHPNVPSGPKESRVEGAGGDWHSGQALLDDFVVERTLGEGGMGKVYLLRSRSTGSNFAVKRAKGLKEADRRNFLAELQTWIDLPEHTNLVPCRFFRTVGDEVLIFAEYVEGGSLKEWIDSQKLYEGGPQQALERVLDVAIQFAWGLHCVHELGLIHQDVKPGNMLMGKDGQSSVMGVKPRVTDYGLARARAAAGEARITDPSRNVLVSSGGGTLAYWSPEQAERRPLSCKTDIWSWGVSVLEMFTGEVSWMSGTGAAEALEEYLHQDGHDPAIPAMPGGVADLLGECFHQDPAGRPASLAEVVDMLKEIYRKSVGADYSRTLSIIKRTDVPQGGIKEHGDGEDIPWRNPQEWLQDALRAAGRDPAEAVAMMARRGMTRRGELVAELAVYDEAKRLYARLVQDGRLDLECYLATLCADKASVHLTAADGQGALQEYNQAVAILERLVNREGRRELADVLAWVYLHKASAVSSLGDHRGAVALYDQVIAIWERLVNQEGRRDLADNLARVYLNKTTAVSALGDFSEAVALSDQAIAMCERLVNQEGRRELADMLARCYMNKATALHALGDHRGAAALLDQAMRLSN